MKQNNHSLLRKSGIVLVLLLALLALAATVSAMTMAVPDQAPQMQLAILPPTPCTADGAGTLTCNLWAKDTGLLLLADGATVPFWGYADSAGGDPQMPGPIIVANEGDTVVVNLTNNMAVTTSMVFPSQTMVPDLTGVAPGGSTTYTFVASNPGTFLYEAGLLPGAQHHVPMGLYGALVVVPSIGAGHAYNDVATAFDEEVLLVLSEIDPDLNANPSTFDLREYNPSYKLINGQSYPDSGDIAVVAGSRVLLRYVNAGLEQHSMGSLGLMQDVIAFNGNQLPYAYSVAAETFGAGVTTDRLVTIPATAGSEGTSRYALYDTSDELFNNGLEGFGGMLTFLTVADGTPAGTGPVTGPITLVPDPTDGTVDVAVSATIPGATSAELFIGSAGAGGSGAAMSPGAGADEWTGTISVADMAALATGGHNVYVHGSDGILWGSFNFAVLDLDKLGPATTGLTLVPNPSDGSVAVVVSATGNDSATGNSNVTAAEFFIGTPGGDGSGTPMSVNVPAPVASVNGTIDAATMSGLVEGAHIVSVHSQDAFGHWGEFITETLEVDQTGPTTSNVVADPNPNNGSTPYSATNYAVRVDATLTDPLTGVNGGADSAIQQVEGFINTVGADGSGFPLSPRDGLYNDVIEDAYAYIPLATINALGAGTHQIWIHGQDASGNWGDPVSVDLVIETDLPVVSNVAVTPDTTDGTVLVDLTAMATDASSDIVIAEWFTGADPGNGNGTLMAISFNGADWDLAAIIDANGWAVGDYTIFVRARDAAGNWSATGSAVLTVTEGLPVPELLYFSTAGGGSTNRVPGVPRLWDDADVYVWNNTVAEFSRILDVRDGALGDILPQNADIDGLKYDSATGVYIMSFNRSGGTDVPGLGIVQDEDVVQYDSQTGQWSMLFAGADVCGGLNTSNGQDISALDVVDGVLYFSPVGGGGSNKIGIGDGITGPFDDADIYAYDELLGCSRVFDGSEVGLLGNADIDGLTVVDADTFYMSFLWNDGTDVPGLGLIPDESVVLYDAGTWSLYFDGTAAGLGAANGQDLDAIDVQ